MKRKAAAFLCAVIWVSGVFAGCGRGEVGTQETQQTQTADTQEGGDETDAQGAAAEETAVKD